MKNNTNAGAMDGIFDSFFPIYGERVPGHGEDSYFCAFDERRALVSVFDGCGGLGAKKYPAYKNHTGAYLASRLASGAVHDWFTQDDPTEGDALVEAVGARIRQALTIGKQNEGRSLVLQGSMVRDFPTTMALGLVVSDNRGVWLHLLWAGDSRVYLLDEDGLAQLTRDDVLEQDAFLNLRADDALQNVIYADGTYTIHHAELRLVKPTLVLACTDGCFGYYSSPMEFEGKLLSAILGDPSPEHFEKAIDRDLREVSGDDYALIAVSLGFGDYSVLQNSLTKRWERLYNEFLVRLWAKRQRGEETGEMEYRFWQSYRQNYERYLPKG